MCLAQGPQCSDASEARTLGPSVSSQALYHRATALPKMLSSLSDSRNTFYHIAWWSIQSGLTTLLSSLIACRGVGPQNFNERNGNLFWSIKNAGEILNKLKSRGFLASSLSTYDFSTLYTTFPHKLIKEKLTEFN